MGLCYLRQLLPHLSGSLSQKTLLLCCHCGVCFRLAVGFGCVLVSDGLLWFLPGGKQRAWRWNGSRTEPTLDPSVTIVHGDHGKFAWWLEHGYWAET